MSKNLCVLFALLYSSCCCIAQETKMTVADSLTFSKMTMHYNTQLMEQPAGAIEVAKDYFEKAQKIKNETNVGKGAAMISTAYFLMDSISVGKIWANKAEQSFIKSGNYFLKGYGNMNNGRILSSKYDFENAIPYYLKSIDDFEKANKNELKLDVYNLISSAYNDFGKYDKGLMYAQKALETLKQNPEIDKSLYWYAYNNMGINYDGNKQAEKAIEAHLKALPYAANESIRSYTYNNLGNTSKKLNRIDAAENYFKLALKVIGDRTDTYHWATIMGNLLDIERIKKNYPSANRYLDSALYYATLSARPEKILDVYMYAYQLKNETGNYISALDYLEKFVNLKDSLFTSEKNNAVLEYQTKYETEKKEKALAETKLQLIEKEVISKQKSRGLLLLASVLLIGLVVFRNHRLKSRLKQKQLTIENKLLQEEANAKILEQRIEISRELHDNLGSHLTLMSSILDGFKRIPEKLDATIIQKMNTLSEFTESSISELKNTIWVLSSKDLNMLELKMKILNFINHASEAKEEIHFHFNFEVKQNIQLNSKQAVNLFRIFQEIVNNTLKHAHAKDLFVDITQIENNLELKISDNGIGFDLEVQNSKSYGLTNIRNRTHEMNGTLALETTAGKGTTYLLNLPVAL